VLLSRLQARKQRHNAADEPLALSLLLIPKPQELNRLALVLVAFALQLLKLPQGLRSRSYHALLN
ncbi:hypothetical protein D043_2284B, partial [Vibrio parahaemolyticus EKP-021]